MMKFAALCLALSAASVSAFAPQRAGVTSTKLNAFSFNKKSSPAPKPSGGGGFDPSNELGAIPPLGFWDPLGLCTSEEKFNRYREVELKHGRVCMVAVVGYITQENIRLAGYISPSADLKFDDIPNGLAAIGAVPALGWLQIFIAAAFFELGLVNQDPDMAPGDYGAGYGIRGKIEDPEERARALNVELSNGRLAMIGALALLVQDKLNGGAYFF